MNNASLLNAVTPIMNSKTAKITMDISAANTEGELMVVVKPMVGPVSDKAPEELRMLSAALAQPIKVVGEPEAIEEKLASMVNEQAGKRTQWANRAAELEAAISAAAAKDAKKAPAKPAAKTANTATAAASGPVTTNQDTDSDTEADDSSINAGFQL